MITVKDAIILLGAVSLVGSFRIDKKKCPKGNGLFPIPGTLCKAFYRCSNWIPFEEMCPGDQLFNPMAGWCDWRDAFPCLDKPKRKECPRDNGQFLKPGTECRIYYDCCNGEPTEKMCPDDQLFDPNRGGCEWSELYKCVEQPKQKECPKENGRFLKPGTDCKRFYDCRYGKPTERECPRDELFDPSLGRCEWIELYTCIEKPKQEVCLKENGRFLKPGTNCKYYYDCRHGKPIERECPIDELFDPSTGSCEWSELYTCVESLSTATPTVYTTSTLFKTSSATSDDDMNYKTSNKNSPPTSSEWYTRSSPRVTGSPITSTVGTTNFRSSPRVTGSPITSTVGTTNFRSSPRVTGSPITRTIGTTNSESSPRVTGSSSPHTSTFGFSDSSVWDVTRTTTVNIWCPEPFGYFPHPTDKHKFVGCVDNVPSVLTCPSNLVYNHKMRQCDYQ